MALYSRKEFIELCGYEWSDSSRAKVAMWIKREKIVEENGKIDDSNPQNRDWILKQRDSSNSKVISVEAPIATMPVNIVPVNKPSKSDNPFEPVEKKLKAAQLEKIRVDTRIAELKEEKIRGEVVPIDLIKSLFRSHTQSIVTAQKDGIEELLINFSAEARLSGEQLARLRGKMIHILNSAVDKAIIVTQKNMQALVNEFSIKKEVGEHD